MNMIKTWMEDLALLPDVGDERWRPLRHHQTTSILGADMLQKTLAELGPVTGWLTEPARVTQLDCRAIDLMQKPLAGEFFQPMPDGGQRVWQLTCLPRGQWSLTEHHLMPCGSDGADTLGESTSHLHADDSAIRLHYLRLWQPDAESAPKCATAVLVGIGGHRA